MASGPVEFIQIPKEHWSVPESINKTIMEDGMRKLKDMGVIYGDSSSYRHMCRFNSGFFFREKALEKYEWYWRVGMSLRHFDWLRGKAAMLTCTRRAECRV